MTTMAEKVIAAGADNCPHMLEKSMYNSWKSRMLLYIRGKEHGKDLLDSIIHCPLQYGTIVENGITRPRIYEELTNKEKIRDECNIRATNIVLQGLPSDLINDMNTIQMTMEKLQVNTKFMNNLQPEWSKFVIDVKLAKDMHESKLDQLYAYLGHNEYNPSQYQQQLLPVAQQFYSSIPQPQSYKAPVHQQPYHAPIIHSPLVTPQQAYQVPTVQQKPQVIFPQLNSGLAVPSFLPDDDLIASLNKAMAFIITKISLRYPTTNN
ncbi:hypothetical protein Tco_0221913 [Tanacetum coccineum]